MAIEAGRVLNQRYRLIRPVGQGSQASVWVAEHLALQTHVAVKLIDPELAKKESARERFRREATAAAQLRSAHVVQILDHGIDGDQPFIVMELLDGEDLFERLSHRGRLTLRETSKIVTQVARALSRAHAAGIVHRDLKPENVFLCPNEDDEVVKVLDFGVAKVKDAARVTMQKTNVGTLIGTPHYMSPEQIKGIGDIDYHTDLWAVGVIAFQCVTGEMPFDSEGVGDLLIKISMGEMPVPSKVFSPAPPQFDSWFALACERDPTKRFQSARELAVALATVVAQVEGTRGPTMRPPAATLPGGIAKALPIPAKVPAELLPEAAAEEDFEEVDPFDEEEEDAKPAPVKATLRPAAPRPAVGTTGRPATAIGLAPPPRPGSGTMPKVTPKAVASTPPPRTESRAPAKATPAPKAAPAQAAKAPPRAAAPAAPVPPAQAVSVAVRPAGVSDHEIVDFDETIPATDNRLSHVGFPLLVRAGGEHGEGPISALSPLDEPPRAPSPPPPAPVSRPLVASVPDTAQPGSIAPVVAMPPRVVVTAPAPVQAPAPVAAPIAEPAPASVPRPHAPPPRPPAPSPVAARATTAPVEVESPTRANAYLADAMPQLDAQNKRRRMVRVLLAGLVLATLGITWSVVRSQLDAGPVGPAASTASSSASAEPPPPPPPPPPPTTTASAVDPGKVTHPTKPGPTYRPPGTTPNRPRPKRLQPNDGTVEIPDDGVPPAP